VALGYNPVHLHPRSLLWFKLLTFVRAFLMVNSEFHKLVTAKANARKIMVMMYVIGHAKESRRTFRI